jgi:8-oxo-dGTP diphosphatase
MTPHNEHKEVRLMGPTFHNTTLCYIEQDGQYLMLHRVKKEHDINKDKWIGIGGKFEDKESPEDCLLREVQEETGLTLTSYAYRGLVTFVSDVWTTEYMHLFTADGFTGTLTDCDEGDLEWVPKDQVQKLPVWTGDKIFLDLLAQDVPFFSLKLVYRGDTLTQAVLNGAPLDFSGWL